MGGCGRPLTPIPCALFLNVYCHRCGLRLPGHARYCAGCGARQVQEGGVVPSNVGSPLRRGLCPRCGAQASSRETCSSCGTPLDPAAGERQTGGSTTLVASTFGCSGCLSLGVTVALLAGLLVPTVRQQALRNMQDRPEGAGPGLTALWLALAVMVAVTATLLLAALGLWARRPWARTLGITLATLGLLVALAALAASFSGSSEGDSSSNQLASLVVGGLSGWSLWALTRPACRAAFSGES